MDYQALVVVAMGVAVAFFTWRASRSGEAWTPNNFLIGFIARAKQPELFRSILIVRLILAVAFIALGILGTVAPTHSVSAISN